MFNGIIYIYIYANIDVKHMYTLGLAYLTGAKQIIYTLIVARPQQTRGSGGTQQSSAVNPTNMVRLSIIVLQVFVLQVFEPGYIITISTDVRVCTVVDPG